MSNVVEAVTYSVLTIEKAGEFADAITYTVVGEEGKWNAEETSFANNSKATLTASIDATLYPCSVFDKILVGEKEYAKPAEITMTAPATATISYKYASLAKPTATLLKDNSKNTIGISWDSVDCADSYTVYKDGVEEQTGVTSKEYWFRDLDEATTYAFSVKAVRGTSESEVSDPVTATTNTTSMNVEITGTFGPKGTASFDDQMFVAASDNAPSEYVAGYALMKLGLTSSIAQIYSNMYNTNLCMIKAPYAANSVADIPLTLYAPAAGNYTLSLGKQVSDGTEIHEFNADGSYTIYLAKGTSNSYSLRLKSTDSEDITIPAAETEANGVNVYVKENVLVIESLAEGGSYSVGNKLRTLNYGVSNGDDVKIPLNEKGVYWVNAGSAKLKCLTNKNHIAMNFRKPEIRKIQIEMEYGVMIPSSDPTPPGF